MWLLVTRRHESIHLLSMLLDNYLYVRWVCARACEIWLYLLVAILHVFPWVLKKQNISNQFSILILNDYNSCMWRYNVYACVPNLVVKWVIVIPGPDWHMSTKCEKSLACKDQKRFILQTKNTQWTVSKLYLHHQVTMQCNPSWEK